MIVYNQNPEKITECILALIKMSNKNECKRVYYAMFFADIFHIQEFVRPVTGDIYLKTHTDILPQTAYAVIHNTFHCVNPPFFIYNYNSLPLCISIQREPNFDLLSKTDISCLKSAISFCSSWSVEDISDIIQGLDAWTKTNIGEKIDYLDLIDPGNPHTEEIKQYIQQTAQTLVL